MSDDIDPNLKQKIWLQQLQDISKLELQVAYNKGNGMTSWIPFSRAIESPIDHRCVLLNEVAYDLDEIKWAHNIDLYLKIKRVLDTYSIPYYAFKTGGKGIHISIYFNFIIENFPKIYKAKNMGMNFKHFRVYIWNKILDLADISRECRGRSKKDKHKALDFSLVDWNDRSKGKMVRICGGRKIRYDEKIDHSEIIGYKSLITEELTLDTNKKTIKDPNNVIYSSEQLKIWTPPSEWINASIEKYVDNHKDNPSLVENMYNGIYFELPCIQDMLQGTDVGLRNNCAQVISIAMAKNGMPIDNMKKILLEFKDRCRSEVGNPFTEDEIYKWAYWAHKEVSYWQCKLSRELGFCKIEGCKLYETQNNEVLEIFNDPHILIRIREKLDEDIVGENSTKLLAFMIELSHISPDLAQWATVSGDSSGGKSWIVLNALKYMPKERIRKASRRTGAALEHGEEDLRYKILVDLEARGAKDAQSSLLTLNSEGELILETTIKDPTTNDFMTINKKVKGPPSYITCNASEEIHAEMATRTWNFGIDPSPEQTKEIVNDYFDKKASLYYLKSRVKKRKENKRTIQEVIRNLKEYPVWIPFIQSFKDRINIDSLRARRDKDKFTAIIEISALLHQANRDFIEVDNEKILVATIDDLIIALEITKEAFKATKLGVNEPCLPILKVVEECTKDTENTLTARDIAKMEVCKVSQRTVSKRCKELYNAGHISLVGGNKRTGFKYTFSQKSSSDFFLVGTSNYSVDRILVSLIGMKEALSNLGLSTPLQIQKEPSFIFSPYLPLLYKNIDTFSLSSVFRYTKNIHKIEIDEKLLYTKENKKEEIPTRSVPSNLSVSHTQIQETTKQEVVSKDTIQIEHSSIIDDIKEFHKFISIRNNGEAATFEEIHDHFGRTIDEIKDMCKKFYDFDSKKFYFSQSGFGMYMG